LKRKLKRNRAFTNCTNGIAQPVQQCSIDTPFPLHPSHLSTPPHLPLHPFCLPLHPFCLPLHTPCFPLHLPSSQHPPLPFPCPCPCLLTCGHHRTGSTWPSSPGAECSGRGADSSWGAAGGRRESRRSWPTPGKCAPDTTICRSTGDPVPDTINTIIIELYNSAGIRICLLSVRYLQGLYNREESSKVYYVIQTRRIYQTVQKTPETLASSQSSKNYSQQSVAKWWCLFDSTVHIFLLARELVTYDHQNTHMRPHSKSYEVELCNLEIRFVQQNNTALKK